jgi:hypothetical protein
VTARVEDPAGNTITSLNFDSGDALSVPYTAAFSMSRAGNYQVVLEAKRTDGSESDSYIKPIKVKDSLCKELVEGVNKPDADRLNLVFIGTGYEVPESADIGELKDKALALLDFERSRGGLFSREPYASNLDKFNFWYVDKLGPSHSSHTEEVLKLNENCVLPNKYTYYVSEEVFRSSASFGPNGHTYLSMPSITSNSVLVGVHESGHLIGNLHDEYIERELGQSFGESYEGENIFADPEEYRRDGDVTVEECLEATHWKNFIGNGCGEDGVIDCVEVYEPDEWGGSVTCAQGTSCMQEIGCFEGGNHFSYDVFRPSYNSIMRHHSMPGADFDEVGRYYTQQQLNRYSGD